MVTHQQQQRKEQAHSREEKRSRTVIVSRNQEGTEKYRQNGWNNHGISSGAMSAWRYAEYCLHIAGTVYIFKEFYKIIPTLFLIEQIIDHGKLKFFDLSQGTLIEMCDNIVI
jgi:hypothetical protein